MSEFKHLISGDGVSHYMRTNDLGHIEILTEGDYTAAIEANKAMFTHNDGYSESRDFRRQAHIPEIVIAIWRNEGFDITDKNNLPELRRRLDSSDYAFLRTAPGRLGRGSGRMV